MRRVKKTYSVLQLASAVLMIVALLWLTVSLPVVYASQQEQQKAQKENLMKGNVSINPEEECSNPMGNNTEEKAPSSNSVQEEFLHDHHKSDYFLSNSSQSFGCEHADTYIAFHGELLVPPPNHS